MNTNNSTHILSPFQCNCLIIISILSSAVILFAPGFASDAGLYAAIAKAMALDHNWINLTANGADWLDKPHLPFWVSCLFFKIFGIHPAIYFLPGILFYLLGGYFTYKLAEFLYDKATASLACILYLNTFAIFLSHADLKAECYLIGEIMPACYFWLKYDKENKLSDLLYGAFFTALAMMTKGIFTIITIMSGLIFMWMYQKEWTKCFSLKWVLAGVVTLLFITPELAALYIQFDLHPEKVIFGHTHVSGIKFFFWDSQFGRFFNNGPITRDVHHHHPFYFVPAFLWQALPWTLLFIVSTYHQLRTFKQETPQNRSNTVYLVSSFSLTFLLFSWSRFQLDHYIFILYPFCSIFCAHYLSHLINRSKNHPLFNIQINIAFALYVASIGLSITLYHQLLFITIAGILLLSFAIYGFCNRYQPSYIKAIVYPSVTLNILGVICILTAYSSFKHHDAGYLIAQYLNQHQKMPIYSYQYKSNTLALYTQLPYFVLNEPVQLAQIPEHAYIVAKKNQIDEIKHYLPHAKITHVVQGLDSKKLILKILNDTHWGNQYSKQKDIVICVL